MPKFSYRRGLSPTHSWKWPRPTLSPSFGLFQLKKPLFRGVSGVCHCLSLVRICPCEFSKSRKKENCSSGKNERGTAKFVNSFILALSVIFTQTANTFIFASRGPQELSGKRKMFNTHVRTSHNTCVKGLISIYMDMSIYIYIYIYIYISRFFV